MLLSETIKTARVTKGWTQTDLAERMGVRQTTVWRWEGGDSEPRIDKLAKLADVLGLDYSGLLELTVQQASTRTAERTRQRAPLRVLKNEPIHHRDGQDGRDGDGTDGNDPGRASAPAGGQMGQGADQEARLTSLEQLVRVLLERVGSLTQALMAAGVLTAENQMDEPGVSRRDEPPSSEPQAPRRQARHKQP